MKTNLRKPIVLCLAFFAWSWVKAQTPAPEPLELNFSPQGGFYHHQISVELSAPEGQIYYTLDGTAPSTRSTPYRNEPVDLTKTTVIRAVAISKTGKSRVWGHTYFIDEPETAFPVVSIGVTPGLLFDPGRGVFMQGGRVVDTLWSKPGANFWSRTEFTVNVEIFETDGHCVYNCLSGFRLFGGMSRLFPQKSMAIVAREQYGQTRIEYPLFGKKGPKDFKYLVLRNAGSDFGKTHFRDALMTGLVDDWDLETQAYRPAHVYINGRYWGIYNMREKVNRFFIEDHSDADRDSIDLIEHYMTRKQGSTRHYRRLLRYLEDHNLRDPAHYGYIHTQMEVENFMNYQIAQIYFDNQDAGGNIKFWRPQTEDGRWRWILYDTDWGFGLQDEQAWRNNSLAFHTEPRGPKWPNPPWSTFVLRKLLENPAFEEAFVTRFADHLNDSFAPEKVNKKIDRLYNNLLPEMPRHLQRWRLDRRKWESQVALLREFAEKRPDYVRTHLMAKFDTGPQRRLNVVAGKGGQVVINETVKVGKNPFSGIYFAHHPVRLRAAPAYGYRFSHWEGVARGREQRELWLDLEKEQYAVEAVFEPFEDPLLGKIVINEIGPNNKKAGDWLELYNRTDQSVTLDGWMLTDARHEYFFPPVTIDANDYLVICQDSAAFRLIFPEAYHISSGLGFGLNKRRETITLYSDTGAAVDSVGYEIPPIDSVFTLSLLLPNLDNSQLDNWEIRAGKGTPNLPNPHFVQSSIRNVQGYWTQMGVAAGVAALCIVLLVFRHRGVL